MTEMSLKKVFALGRYPVKERGIMIVGVEVGVVGPKWPRPLPRPLGLPDWCKSLFESQNPPFSAEIRRPFWVTFGGCGL